MPGTITVSIRAVDGSGKPTGSDLTSGTYNGDSLGTGSGGTWIEIPVTEYTLTANTTYAIVIRAPDGDVSNYLGVNMENPGNYANGGNFLSVNSGSSWGADQGTDIVFEIWGGSLNRITKVNTATVGNFTKIMGATYSLFTKILGITK